MNIFEGEIGNVLNFYCIIQTLGGNALFQLNEFRLVQHYPFNILTVQKEISSVSLVLFLRDSWYEFGSFFKEDSMSMETKITKLF